MPTNVMVSTMAKWCETDFVDPLFRFRVRFAMRALYRSDLFAFGFIFCVSRSWNPAGSPSALSTKLGGKFKDVYKQIPVAGIGTRNHYSPVTLPWNRTHHAPPPTSGCVMGGYVIHDVSQGRSQKDGNPAGCHLVT